MIEHPHGSSRRARTLFIAIALLLSLGLWFATNEVLRRTAAARVPPLPDLASAPGPVADQLRAADADARAHPTVGAYLGRLAMAYHANTYSQEARPIYGQARDHDPGDWRWKWGMILLDEEVGDTEGALASLREYTSAHEGDALAWLHRGMAAFNLGHDDEAAEAFARARDAPDAGRAPGPRPAFFPLSAYARLGLARLAFRRGDYQAAASIIEPVTAGAPRFGPAHRLLGEALRQLGRDDEAAAQFGRALRCGPYTPPVDSFIDDLALVSASSTFLLKEAGVAFNKGDVAWSERLLRRALELYPRDEDVLGELALLLVRQRRFDDAAPLLDRFLSLPPTHYATPSKIGAELATQRAHIDRAIECYRTALDLLPDHAANHLNLGMALAVAGRYDEAEPLFRQALEMEPHNDLARRNLARLMFDTKRYAEAAVAFEALLDARPDDAEARFLLGRARELLNETAAALEAYNAALEVDPDHEATLEALAMLLAQEDRIDDALVRANHLVAIAPNSARAHYALARIAVLAGNAGAARAACQRALELDAGFQPARELLDRIPD